MIYPILSSKVLSFQYEANKGLPVQSQVVERNLKYVHDIGLVSSILIVNCFHTLFLCFKIKSNKACQNKIVSFI